MNTPDIYRGYLLEDVNYWSTLQYTHIWAHNLLNNTVFNSVMFMSTISHNLTCDRQ